MQTLIDNLVGLLRRQAYAEALAQLDAAPPGPADSDDLALLRLVATLRTRPEALDAKLLSEAARWRYADPDALFSERAFVAMIQGDARAALAILDAVPAARYGPVEYSRLGTARLLNGDFLGARDAYRSATELDPGNADLQNNLGGALVRLQLLDDALLCYDRCLLLEPDHPQALQSRLTVAHALGRGENLLDELEQRLAGAPDGVEARLALFYAMKRLHRDEEAIALLKPVLVDLAGLAPVTRDELALDAPRQAQMTYRLALYDHFFQDHKWAQALAAARQCLAMLSDAPLELHLRHLAALVEAHRYAPAAALLEDLAARADIDAEQLRLTRAEFLFKKGAEAEAAALLAPPFEQALLEKRAKSLRAQIDLALGKIDAVQAQLLELAQSDIMAYVQLVNSRSYQPDDAVLQSLRNLADNVLTPEGVRNAVSFALADVYDKRKQYALAFDYLRAANEIDRRKIAFRPEQFSRQVDALIATVDAAALAKLPKLAKSRPAPIFVVGMPRSGTTLTESILGSHPDISAAGELPGIAMLSRLLHKQWPAVRPYPAGLLDLSAAQAVQLAKAYLHAMPEHCRDSAMLVDKMPHNFTHLGLIHLLFPHSPIIHVQRDPRDTALSNYQQNFGAKYGALGYASDLGHMAQQFNDYFRLMAHWRAVGIPMFEFYYEDLVADQETVSRQLLAYAGVAWDEQVKEFHTLERAVRTASVAQVRQKIYTSSKQKWRHYETELAPFIERLAPGLTAPWDTMPASENGQ